MKINRVLYRLNATLPALLSFILLLIPRAGIAATAADFPAVVAFELGTTDLLPGDSITIQQLRGTSPTIRTGETYYVEGTYTLASKDKADLAWYATTSSSVPTPTDAGQIVRVEKGVGTFRLVKTMREEGYLHLSFYPVPGGSSFGDVYFGQGNGVLRQRWSRPHQAAQALDNTTTGAATTQTVSMSGPNAVLFAYLGDPVPPPADMDPAYTKEGLTTAIQTAARKAGISVRRIEIEDSEYPFLVGVICKEGEFPRVVEQLRKMTDYEYNGCTSTPTHSAFNMVPYRVFPSQVSERISHRTGLRCQIFLSKLPRLE